jgi:hypothetical protein
MISSLALRARSRIGHEISGERAWGRRIERQNQGIADIGIERQPFDDEWFRTIDKGFANAGEKRGAGEQMIGRRTGTAIPDGNAAAFDCGRFRHTILIGTRGRVFWLLVGAAAAVTTDLARTRTDLRDPLNLFFARLRRRSNDRQQPQRGARGRDQLHGQDQR